MALRRDRASLDLTSKSTTAQVQFCTKWHTIVTAEGYLDNRFAALLDPTSIAESSDDSDHDLAHEKLLGPSQENGPQIVVTGNEESDSKSNLPSPTTSTHPLVPSPTEPDSTSAPAPNDNDTPRQPDAPIAIPVLDPRKLIKADTFSFSSPRGTPNYPLADAPSHLTAEDLRHLSRTSTVPRPSNTYDPSLKRMNFEDTRPTKHARPPRRASRHANYDREFTGLYMGRVALSIEPRLARHFPCRLPPAPAPSTRTVCNLLAVPPTGLARRSVSEETPFRNALVSRKGEMQLKDITSSTIMSGRDEGRSNTSGGEDGKEGEKDGDRGSESDWEGLEMGYWRDG